MEDPKLFENRVVRMVFGSDRQETAENCTIKRADERDKCLLSRGRRNTQYSLENLADGHVAQHCYSRLL